MTDDQTALNAGFQEELDFWEEQISGRGQYSMGVLSRLNMSKQPPEYRHDFEPLILELGREMGRLPQVLDVGSGPASIFSWGHKQGTFDLIAVDPLASRYQELLRRYGYEPTSPMLDCAGEDLAAHFPPGRFDFAWSFNSIDHSRSPAEVLTAMAAVVRPGGLVIVQCFEKEGTAAAWTGLHGFDITKGPHGEMLCTTRDGRTEGIEDGRLRLVDLGITQAYLPKTVGRDWLAFFYRRV